MCVMSHRLWLANKGRGIANINRCVSPWAYITKVCDDPILVHCGWPTRERNS